MAQQVPGFLAGFYLVGSIALDEDRGLEAEGYVIG
jgi:hypothetical protein